MVTSSVLEDKTMVRGRRPKVVRATKSERFESIREEIINLPSRLIDDGFGALLAPPAAIQTLTEPIRDPKTDGWIGHVEEPLGSYLQRVSIKDNFSQRPPYDHATDPIYRRLIKDFIDGAAMPESKIAALRSASRAITETLNAPDISYSVIDGLQRLYCYCLALLLVWRREALVADGLVTQETWEYFEDSVEKTGDPREATETLLQRTMRYEIFWNIHLAGLLHYMVTFNTAQRRMPLHTQLEIMRAPLIAELEQSGMPIWHDIDKTPGKDKPRDQFAAADLILATQAFITGNPQLSANTETERFLNENELYLDNVGDIKDVAHTLKRLTTEIHPKIAQRYAPDSTRRHVLSAGGTFLLSLAAACGYVRNRGNMKMLDGALDKLTMELGKPGEDPLNLEEYQLALTTITSSRGKAIRRLVNDTFARFFNGATTRLEWLDTASQITG